MMFRKTVVGLLCGLGIVLAASAAGAAESAQPIYAAKGEQTCLKCHDDAPTNLILQTPHAVKGDARTPFANHGCESCHGASPEHVDSRPAKGEKKVRPAVVFNGPDASPVSQRNGMCLNCHENQARMNWQGSQHSSNDVACDSCHTVHAKKDPVLVKATQPEKCFTCHKQQRADSFQYSHHPVREGKVVCSDCHNPHGSMGPKQVKEATINDTCYNCHAEKRGPFLWEHQPVRESCTNCHNPHGSPQAAMLTERMPYLCSSCHSGAVHGTTASSRVSSGSWFGGAASLPGGSPNNALVGVYLNNRACLNCHSNIHGSNSPAGEAFLR